MTNTAKEQYGAYASQTQQTPVDIDGRETDRRALMNCAARLNVALTDGGKDMKEYIEAIRHNQRLWTIFQVALCDPENPLPREAKGTLLNLSRYVDRVSFRAVTEFSPQLLNSLIDINRIIAKGLMPKKPLTDNPPKAAQIQAPPANPSSVQTSV